MLKTRQNFRAPFFALIVLLCGVVGLTFEDAAAQDADMCNLTSAITMTVAPDAEKMERICREFGGEIQDGAKEKKICSRVDANDTFCIIADKDAFPCLGLLRHVRKCNCEHNRPALNPFFCGKCDDQSNAIGAKCIPTDDAINSGYIYPVAPISLVASYDGNVFAVSATIQPGDVAMELSHSAFTFSFTNKVGTVGVRPNAGLQGVTLSRHPVTLTVRFTVSSRGITSTTRVYTVTAVAKPGALTIYNPADHPDGRNFVLPTYGYPDLAYQSNYDDDRKIIITDDYELFWPSEPGVTVMAVTLTATSSQFLGDLLLPLSAVIDCKPTDTISTYVANMSLVAAAKSGRDQDACNALKIGGAEPTHLAAMTAAFDSITNGDLLDGKQEIILMLLSGGADPNSQFSDGDYALHKAVKAGDKFLSLAQVLAGYGAHLNPRNRDGKTPLMLAAENSGRNRILDYLVGELAGGLDRQQVQTSMALGGGDCDTDENCTLKTALHYAVDGMNLAGIRRLLDAGASATALDNAGKAPIHYVAERLMNLDDIYSKLLCALLSGSDSHRRAQLDLRTSDGDTETAEEIAKGRGVRVGKLFEHYSSPVNCR